MITYIQAVFLGALQGITELFPISSLGHSVLIPSLLHWNINQSDNLFLIFLVATHLATAIVLLAFFFKDWVLIVKGIVRSLKNRIIDEKDTYAKLGWLIIVSSIPAGILGLLLQEKLKSLFASPAYVSVFLILNGFLLFGAEMLRKKSEQKRNQKSAYIIPVDTDKAMASMTWSQSVKVGLAQCLALIPGFSRTGATLGGALLVGLNHEEAARFSFLLATPIILAASILKLPELLTVQDGTIIGPILLGSVVSGLTAYFSIRFLTKYFKSNDLNPFAIYCIIAGLFALAVLFLHF